MEIVNFPNQIFNAIGATGVCPHCSCQSLFQPVGAGYKETKPDGNWQMVSSAQCQACKEYVLVLGVRHQNLGNGPYALVAVYPLGKPNESVDPAVPPSIATDFQEALRCQWVKAYKATVTMCRRALQASCIELKAKDAKLQDQIDELAKSGVITRSLKEMAHQVRLTGNDGAHPGKDGLNDVTEEDAKDIIEFTREFFHHVFVVDAKIKARQATPPASAAAAKP